MTTKWVYWYRQIGRYRSGPWQFFFASDEDDFTSSLRSIRRSGYEHVVLPAGEFPDEQSRLHSKSKDAEP